MFWEIEYLSDEEIYDNDKIEMEYNLSMLTINAYDLIKDIALYYYDFNIKFLNNICRYISNAYYLTDIIIAKLLDLLIFYSYTGCNNKYFDYVIGMMIEEYKQIRFDSNIYDTLTDVYYHAINSQMMLIKKYIKVLDHNKLINEIVILIISLLKNKLE